MKHRRHHLQVTGRDRGPDSLEKYYTLPHICKDVVQQVLKAIKGVPAKTNITFIDPCAGPGRMLDVLKQQLKGSPARHRYKFLAFDIAPDHPDVVRRDFLKKPYRRTRADEFVVAFTNPPFGTRNNDMAKAFIKTCCDIADVMIMLIPDSFLNYKTSYRVWEDPHWHHTDTILYGGEDKLFTVNGDPFSKGNCAILTWTLLPVRREPYLDYEPENFVRDLDTPQMLICKSGHRAGHVFAFPAHRDYFWLRAYALDKDPTHTRKNQVMATVNKDPKKYLRYQKTNRIDISKTVIRINKALRQVLCSANLGPDAQAEEREKRAFRRKTQFYQVHNLRDFTQQPHLALSRSTGELVVMRSLHTHIAIRSPLLRTKRERENFEMYVNTQKAIFLYPLVTGYRIKNLATGFGPNSKRLDELLSFVQGYSKKQLQNMDLTDTDVPYSEVCCKCLDGGHLICCDSQKCHNTMHLECANLTLLPPNGTFYCEACRATKTANRRSRKKRKCYVPTL